MFKLSKKWSDKIKRQLDWELPLDPFKGERATLAIPSEPVKPARIKKYTIQVSRRRTLFITLRRFKTQKSNRSKKDKVLKLRLVPYKEVAFRQVIRKRVPYIPETLTFTVHPRLISSRLFLIIGISGLIFFGVKLFKPVNIQPIQTFTTKVQANTLPFFLPQADPLRIRVPSIAVDANVVPVGKATDGGIETPPINDLVGGWYKYSPTPGELGPSIIVGHVDTETGPSIFWRLRELQPGTIIEVDRSDGSVAKFSVSGLQQFDQNQLPSNEIYGDIDYAGLSLITCSGTFYPKTRQYSSNIVVFAKLIPNNS